MTEDKEYDRGKRKIVLVGLGHKAYYYNYKRYRNKSN